MGKNHASQYANFGSLRWCGTKLRNKIAEQIQFRPSSQKNFGEEGLNDIRSDAKEIIPDYPFLSVPARQ